MKVPWMGIVAVVVIIGSIVFLVTRMTGGEEPGTEVKRLMPLICPGETEAFAMETRPSDLPIKADCGQAYQAVLCTKCDQIVPLINDEADCTECPGSPYTTNVPQERVRMP